MARGICASALDSAAEGELPRSAGATSGGRRTGRSKFARRVYPRQARRQRRSSDADGPNGLFIDVGTPDVRHSIDDDQKYVAHYRFPRPKFTKRSAVSGADRGRNDPTEHIMDTNRKKSVTSPLHEAVAAAVPAQLLFVAGPSRPRDNRFRWHSGHRKTVRSLPMAPIYQVTDRLHEGRTVHVPCHEIGTTVSAWLAELGAQSQLVEDLARAVDADDWPTAYAIGERLSIEVTRSA